MFRTAKLLPRIMRAACASESPAMDHAMLRHNEKTLQRLEGFGVGQMISLACWYLHGPPAGWVWVGRDRSQSHGGIHKKPWTASGARTFRAPEADVRRMVASEHSTPSWKGAGKSYRDSHQRVAELGEVGTADSCATRFPSGHTGNRQRKNRAVRSGGNTDCVCREEC